MTLVKALRQRLFRVEPDSQQPIVLIQRRIFILPTGAGLLYVLVLIVMLLGAINYSLSLGHALVFLLAGQGLVTMVHTFRNLVALRVSSGRTEPVFAGETAKFQLCIDNPRDHERRALEFAFSENPCVLLDLPPNRKVTIDIPYTAQQRGRLNPGHITVSTRYPLGLFRAWSYPYPPFSCLVYPKILSTPLPYYIDTAHYGQNPGDLGQDDFIGLRLHQPNDSPRHIAWKSVARHIDHRPLLVKQFAGGTNGELMLDWALTPENSDIETRLSILTGWVLAAERQNLCYGLRLPGIDVEPSHGNGHYDTCLKALALYGETD